jgi:hypothetical protein
MIDLLLRQAPGLLGGVLLTLTTVWIKQTLDDDPARAPLPAAGTASAAPAPTVEGSLAQEDPFERRLALHRAVAALDDAGLEAAYAEADALTDERWRRPLQLALLDRIAAASDARALALAGRSPDAAYLLPALLRDRLEADWDRTLDLLAVANVPRAVVREVLAAEAGRRTPEEMARAEAVLRIGVGDGG